MNRSGIGRYGFVLAMVLVLVGCGKQEAGPARDKPEKAAIEGAKAAPKRAAVSADKLQNRAGSIYVVNGQEPFSGTAQDAYANGQIHWEAGIEAGKVVAVKRWHENGVLELTCGFTEATLDDITRQVGPLLTGCNQRLDGEFAAYYDNGQKCVTATFKRGACVGELVCWRQNGALQIKASFENGALVHLETYGESGKMQAKAGFIGGGFGYAFADIGKLKAAAAKELQGELALYHPNGQMAAQCTLDNGKVKGPERVWTPDGTEIKTVLVESLSLEMIRVAPGTFQMGSPAAEEGRSGDEKSHAVTITKEYWLGRYEVTQGEWETLIGSNPSSNKGAAKRLPVENVSWDDAMGFCEKLTEAERLAGRLPVGYAYTLPTEAQWEFACRAGSAGSFAGDLDAMGWYDANSGSQTHSVGQKQMNALGFSDMHGSVWEWCRDYYGDYSEGSAADPVGSEQGSFRVSRGGGWYGGASFCRSAFRGRGIPGSRGGDLGFRLCLAPVRQ